MTPGGWVVMLLSVGRSDHALGLVHLQGRRHPRLHRAPAQAGDIETPDAEED